MERIYHINNSKVTIKFGNITESKAEVIVSSDDCFLSMGGGISATLRNKAGLEMVKDARKKIPAALGDVVVTSAGMMEQKFLFHAITIGMDRLNRIDHSQQIDVQQYIIHYAVKKVFRLLNAMEISSIAFPAIGAGAARIPYSKVAQCMGEAFAEALSMTNKVYDVELYLYDRYGKMGVWEFLPFFEAMAKAEQWKRTTVNGMKVDAEVGGQDVVIKDAKEYIHESAKIFISYSRKDYNDITQICALLNQMGLSYWIDIDGSYSGENFKSVIVDAINKAELVLFISSENSNSSTNVAKEISLADKLNKTILPIRLDNTAYASMIEYDLIGIDYIDYINREPSALEKLRKSILGRLMIEGKLVD